MKNPSRFTLMSKNELREFLIIHFNEKEGRSEFYTTGKYYEIHHKVFGPNLYRVWLTEIV